MATLILTRTCVDAWMVDVMSSVTERHGASAVGVLFDHNPGINGCLFDALTRSFKVTKPELHFRIRARCMAAVRNGNNSAEDVRAILSM